jgi:hypothetical protein
MSIDICFEHQSSKKVFEYVDNFKKSNSDLKILSTHNFIHTTFSDETESSHAIILVVRERNLFDKIIEYAKKKWRKK